MIKNNNFFIENLSSVVFLGESNAFPKLVEVNKNLNLKTLIITSSHQSKLIKKVNYKIFDNLDDKFKKFINKNLKIKIQFLSVLELDIFLKKTQLKIFF